MPKTATVIMKTGVALEIVWQLARQNALDPETRDIELRAEAARQEEALRIVEDLIVNEYGEDEEDGD